MRSDGLFVDRLVPAIDLPDGRYSLEVAAQFPIESARLKKLRIIASLGDERDTIMNAINFLYRGI